MYGLKVDLMMGLLQYTQRPDNKLDDSLGYKIIHGFLRLNSGLGYSICCRLIDEFISIYPKTLNLHLIITTRDEKKSNDTLSRLSAYLDRKSKKLSTNLSLRVSFQGELLDLTSLRSVKALSEKLLATLPILDVVIVNAGYGGLTGVNWLRATWAILTDFPYSVTYPSFNINGVGLTTKPQTSSRDEPPLGTVFTSNLFGHYLLIHQLTTLLRRYSQSDPSARIIWISSVEGYASTFSPGDIQGLAADSAYSSSKRLTDILTLTSALPSTEPYVANLLGQTVPKSERGEGKTQGKGRPEMYVTHPGICATSFVPLPWILYYMMTLTFYFARWVGSPWHTVTSYKGAAAPVWLALTRDSLYDLEVEGKVKWGSCVSRGGRESVLRTEVEGWGVQGRVEKLDKGTLRGRRRGVNDLTGREREEFEELGRECWQQMETLRKEWEKRMGW